jgi:hypothetical protein
VFSTYKEIMPLFYGYPGVDELIPMGWDIPKPDAKFCVRLMDLPQLCKTTPDRVPPDPGHFRAFANSHKMVHFQTEPWQVKVGIAWSGRIEFTRKWNRSMPLQTMMRLAANPMFELFSFQVEPQASDIHRLGVSNMVHDLSSKLTSWSMTAVVLKEMDVVITVDTAIAHLAGALGIPTILCICKTPDWRWLLNRDDTPWYPSITIVRQSELGRWDDVIERAEVLAEQIMVERGS